MLPRGAPKGVSREWMLLTTQRARGIRGHHVQETEEDRGHYVQERHYLDGGLGDPCPEKYSSNVTGVSTWAHPEVKQGTRGKQVAGARNHHPGGERVTHPHSERRKKESLSQKRKK